MKVIRFDVNRNEWIEVNITDIDNFFDDVVWTECPFAFIEWKSTKEIDDFLDVIEDESAGLDDEVYYSFDCRMCGRNPEEVFIFFNNKIMTFTEYNIIISDIYNDMVKLKME